MLKERFMLNLGRIPIIALAVLCSLSLFSCGTDSPPADTAVLPIPKGINPCEHPGYWPYSAGSNSFPFVVHYRSPDELAMVRTIITGLNEAWDRQIIQQGYTPPIPDAGKCGPDDRFDVFVWRGANTCQVNIIDKDTINSWGGRPSYMQLDPWGDYGGPYLTQTIAHEFNHATHAANDWNDLPVAFEMSATYVEQFYDGPSDPKYIMDFQAHPDWSLLRNDDYQTWYMYGSFLYLDFLRDYYFHGDDGFLPQLWVAMRNTPDLSVNSPNFVDGINLFLNPTGATFLDSVVQFARWRYYAGTRDDGEHFRSTQFPMAQVIFAPEATLQINQVVLKPLTYLFNPAPMLIGSAYLEIKRETVSQTSFQLSLDAPPDPSIRWVVQAVPGLSAGSDGELVDLSAGSAQVFFAPTGTRTLILTAVPTADFDVNSLFNTTGDLPRTLTAVSPSGATLSYLKDMRYPVSVRIAP